ncbi:MAG: DUF1080 domain-containing protein [Anaerolineaceae bacterium]|nr:DUF1080 domain-containing protein [Anaerolineaceae bacterium]
MNGVEQMAVSLAASRSRSLPIVMGVVFCAHAVLALILAAPSLAGPLAGPSPAEPLDLTMSKDASPARVASGGLVTYTVVFTNNTDQVNTLDATHNCCVSPDKEAADALLMYLGAGAEDWTDYRVETKLLLRGGVDKEHNWSVIDGDPIGLWVRGQYEYEEGVTIRAQWVTGYYVVVAGKPDRDNLVVRLTQIQTVDDCVGDACENPQNLYCFNNVYVLAETPLYKPFYREQWYKLAVEVRGPRTVVWLDDEKVIDYVDTKEPFLKGTVGFKTHETWTASFDDLIVTPLY